LPALSFLWCSISAWCMTIYSASTLIHCVETEIYIREVAFAGLMAMRRKRRINPPPAAFWRMFTDGTVCVRLIMYHFLDHFHDMLSLHTCKGPMSSKYNHTCDEDYVIKTGKDNTDNLASIQRWANMSNLPWWGDDYSSVSWGTCLPYGTFQKPGLKKTDRLKQFQSFALLLLFMAFYLHYDSDTNVKGINAMRFKMDTDTYDTTLELNKGYRYENTEMVPNANGCSNVDCSLFQNWCDGCCNGTHYKSTVFLPPGIVPLRCLPGQNVPLPFAGFLSPPHFLWSPPEVQDNTYGLHPDPELHDPATFDIQPLTGSTVNGQFRMQLSVPIYNNQGFTESRQLKNSFLPSFWVGIRVAMRDYAHDYIYFNTTELPRIVLGIGIGLVAGSVLAALIWAFFGIRRKGTGFSSIFKKSGRSSSWSPL
uniref:DUF4773 domain-containing protein n=1 Tax=Heligmosomoides polygyrus TaxID=6339 RepID=A0A8L8Q4H4_HELPZ